MEILQFKPEHLPLVISLARRTIDRPASDSLYTWLYRDCPSVTGLLAVDDSVCVAMIWAFRRSYRIGPAKHEFLEGFDWYCRPEARGSGIGVQLLRRFMKDFPMLTVDGSEDARDLLPRMQWKHLADVSLFQLPLRGQLLAKTASPKSPWTRLLEAGFASTARPWFLPRGRGCPAEGHTVAVGGIGPEVVEDLYWQDRDFAGLIPLPDERFIRWLVSAHSAVGHYLPLYFTVGKKLKGWSLSRIFESPRGAQAAIVDLYSPKSCGECYPWIVAETSRILAGFNPIQILAKSSHPSVMRALRQNRFISTSTMAAYVWRCPGSPKIDEVFLASTCNDSPFLPYANQWLLGV